MVIKTVFLLVVLLVCSSPAQTEKMKLIGRPEKLTSGIVAVRDVNSRFCAGIQIISDREGFTYDSNNGVVRVDHKPGMDIVYLQPDERVLRIYHRGYEPLILYLYDAGIQLHPKDMWKIRLSLREIYKGGKGSLEIETIPPGAKITIDGIPDFSKTSPYRFNKLAARTWKIFINKSEYEPDSFVVSIKKNRFLPKKIRLIPRFGYIAVSSNVDRPQLFINDEVRPFTGNQPFKVPVGTVRLLLKKKYYDDFQKVLEIKPNDNPDSSLFVQAVLKRQNANLEIDSSVPSTQIYLDGFLIGATPLHKTVSAGFHTVEARKAEYRSEKKSLDFLGGQTQRVYFNMTRNGLLSIKGTNQATVYIDGVYQGLVPLYNLELEPGRHRIRLVKEGFDEYSTIISIASNRKTFDYTLSPTEGRFFRFTTFGNKRIAQISNGFTLAFGAYNWKIPILFFQDLIPPETPEQLHIISETGFYASATLIQTPFTFGFGYRWQTTNLSMTEVDKDSLETGTYFGYIGLTPFVLFEKIYPMGGIFYGYNKFKYQIDRSSQIEMNKPMYGFYYGLRFRFSRMIFLQAAYLDVRKNLYFHKSIQLQLGILFNSDSPRKKKKTK